MSQIATRKKVSHLNIDTYINWTMLSFEIRVTIPIKKEYIKINVKNVRFSLLLETNTFFAHYVVSSYEK